MSMQRKSMLLSMALLTVTACLNERAPSPQALPSGTMSEVQYSIELPQAQEHRIQYAIRPGDSLSRIFGLFGLSQATIYQILEADESLLALDILRPGHSLIFTLGDTGDRLDEMELVIHPANKVIYRRIDEASFDYEEILIPGDWQQELLTGQIDGSFYLSAKHLGLSEAEIAEIDNLFKDQLDFARQIRAGDRFQILRSRQYLDGQATGQSRLDGIRFLRRNQTHSAFLFEDGNYYDHNGDSLARAFMRFPTTRPYRVSSHFHPRRVHPVTGRRTPHNGTDFAMPVGTPVLATSDGVVTRVGNHPFAGRYIEIRHGSQYLSRYLHLHRILVRKGQQVSRGGRIALSGNTGRSTGPHLHYELHINGRPVNPLTAKLPIATSVPRDRRAQFDRLAAELVRAMEQPDHRLALRN